MVSVLVYLMIIYQLYNLNSVEVYYGSERRMACDEVAVAYFKVLSKKTEENHGNLHQVSRCHCQSLKLSTSRNIRNVTVSKP